MTKASLQAFKREVFVMNCLRHPNVVLMMGACQDPPKLAILMEYVAGGSLYQVWGLIHPPALSPEPEYMRLAPIILRLLYHYRCSMWIKWY